LVRTPVDGISVVGRNTQGVTIIKLGKNEKVIGVDRIEGLAGVDDADDDELLDDADLELDASDETTNDGIEPGEES
jgi:DNA gyrase subunit A